VAAFRHVLVFNCYYFYLFYVVLEIKYNDDDDDDDDDDELKNSDILISSTKCFKLRQTCIITFYQMM